MSAVRIVAPASRADTPSGSRLQYRAVQTADLIANITVDAWARLLGLIADGVAPHQAIGAVGATRALVEGMVRSSPERLKQWTDAKIACERRHWDLELVSAICNDVAAGLSVQSACKKRDKLPESFIKLVLMDPMIAEEYSLARKIRSEMWADETIEISDEEHNDLDLTGRGNMAAVKRSEVRIQARRRLMEDFSKERFGGAKKGDTNIQVNINAAERLEAARARRNALRVVEVEGVKDIKDTVKDAEFKESMAEQVLPDWLK